VPEEFADAYRRAYDDAMGGPAPAPEPEPERPELERPVGAHADWAAADRESEPAAGWTEYSVESPYHRFRGSRWFVPGLLTLAALVLVGGAYGVGRIFAAGVQAPTARPTQQTTIPASDPHGHVVQEASRSGSHQTEAPRPRKPRKPKTGPWHGRVTSVQPTGATARCVAPDAVDAAGHRVSYRPGNAVDGRADTTWRCPGKAIGRELVIHLPGRVAVGEVGLVPGYAKTDPVSHADRYAQNNRITEARWILGNGTTVVQHLSGSAHDRALRTIRVPRTVTGTIRLQVLAVRPGPFHTTCVSEVRVGKAV
jgi:hypothetical protein